MNEQMEKRLWELRHEFMRAEMLTRAIRRIASDADCSFDVLQEKLEEVETLAEMLTDLLSDTSGQMEPSVLERHVASLEKVTP